MKKEDGIDPIFVGIDESNHGRYPEFFTAVFSQILSDISLHQLKIQKERHDHKDLFKSLAKRDYAFLRLYQEDEERLGNDKLGIVIASLVHQKIKEGYDFYIFVDALEERKISRAREVVSEITGLEKKFIMIQSSSDEQRRILHDADELAHYLFRHATPYEIATKYKSHKVELLR